MLDTGVSEHGAVQAAADRLLSATIDRAASLLGDADVRSDADVQEALLELLGPLQGVLNDSRLRRPLFGKLPFEALRVWLLRRRCCAAHVLPAWGAASLACSHAGCLHPHQSTRSASLRASPAAPQDCVLADGKVCADAEVTVLAAFCYWVESGPAGEHRDVVHEVHEARLAAICSRIRLPVIPPSLLHSYWAQFRFLRRYDPGNQILLRAVTTGRRERVSVGTNAALCCQRYYLLSIPSVIAIPGADHCSCAAIPAANLEGRCALRGRRTLA